MSGMEIFNLLLAYRAFRDALNGGSCEVSVFDSNFATPREEGEFRWRISTGRSGKDWIFLWRFDPSRELPGTEIQLGQMIAARARAAFSKDHPTVTAEPPAAYSDSAY